MDPNYVPSFDTCAIHAGANCISPPKAIEGGEIYHYSHLITPFPPISGRTEDPFWLSVDSKEIISQNNRVGCHILEERIAALEGGTAALAVCSLHAARFLVFKTLMHSGDEIIASHWSHGQVDSIFAQSDWNVKWIDSDNLSALETAITARTKAIFIESISGLGNRVSDISGISKIARRAKIPLIVENTTASPYLCRPIEHGADIVLHSAAEFIGGYETAEAGIIIDAGSFNWAGDDRYPSLTAPCLNHGNSILYEEFGNFALIAACRIANLHHFGLGLSPISSFLVLSGMETLPLRMQRHSDNARCVAEFLAEHPEVLWIDYIGLPGNPHHKLALKYCPNGSSSIVTFGLNVERVPLEKFIADLQLFSYLPAVGGARSRVMHLAPFAHHHPASSVQSHMARDLRGAVRLSIGLEGKVDIIADLGCALSCP